MLVQRENTRERDREANRERNTKPTRAHEPQVKRYHRAFRVLALEVDANQNQFAPCSPLNVDQIPSFSLLNSKQKPRNISTHHIRQQRLMYIQLHKNPPSNTHSLGTYVTDSPTLLPPEKKNTPSTPREESVKVRSDIRGTTETISVQKSLPPSLRALDILIPIISHGKAR